MIKIPTVLFNTITNLTNPATAVIENHKELNIETIYDENTLDEYINKYDHLMFFEDNKFKTNILAVEEEDRDWVRETILRANENLPEDVVITDEGVTNFQLEQGGGSSTPTTDAPWTCYVNGSRITNYNRSGFTAENSVRHWWGYTIEKKLNSCDTAKYVFGDSEDIFIDQGWRDYFYNNPERAEEYAEMIGTTVATATEIATALSTGGAAPHGFGLVIGTLVDWSFNQIFGNLDIIGDKGWGTLRNYMWDSNQISLLATEVLDVINNEFYKGIRITGKDGWIPGDAAAYGPFIQ